MEGIRRPKIQVLSDDALVRERSEEASPLRFTHVVHAAQPYYLTESANEALGVPGLPEEGREPLEPVGVFEVGTELVLVERGNGVYCTVMDGQRRVVITPCAGLVSIERSSG